MRQRNLLLCFDAFGTLFQPRRPVAEQYAAVARQCGLEGVRAEQVAAAFKAAYAEEARAHPNYGKATGMGADRWWTNVIHKTFQPLAGPGRELPGDLAPRLLHRFTSDEGYAMSPGVDSLLRRLKQKQQQQQQQQRQSARRMIVVGVITNSDDRVPSVLSSFGLRVSPLRCGVQEQNPSRASPAGPQQQGDYDIDLHCMSYDVGFAKPDRRIFDATEAVADGLVAASRDGGEDAPWLKMYVGDEFEKDVKAAWAAGWNSVLVGAGAGEGTEGEEGLLDLDQCAGTTLDDCFPQEKPPSMIRAESTQALLEWLIQKCR